MTKDELVEYWLSGSKLDEKTFCNLLKSRDNHWALFMGHIVIEKLLKALVVQNSEEGVAVPRSHDLLLLAQKAHLEVSDRQEDLLDLISTFNINARYPDYKQAFYKKCTNEYTKKRAAEINEVFAWLKNLIQP
ncbi:MAG: HEPN domain-containing protein [Oscillospiraceae bacterium]|nr:HEPN domain-containing protein [Oscillospiraceae bacterium]